MKAFNWLDSPRMVWSLAWGLALTGLAGVFVLFPKWPAAAVLPQPAAPRFVLAGAGPAALGEAAELRAIRSPSLMALSHRAAIPNGTLKQVDGVNAPVGMLPDMPAGLGMAPFVRRESSMREFRNGFSHKNFLSIGMSAGMPKSPVFQSEPAGGTRGVSVEYGEGLQARSVEVADWSWDPWIQPGVPWTLSLDLLADDQGRIVQVLLDAPSVDPALNEVLIRTLYQRGRVRPAGACQGRVKVSFSGVP